MGTAHDGQYEWVLHESILEFLHRYCQLSRWMPWYVTFSILTKKKKLLFYLLEGHLKNLSERLPNISEYILFITINSSVGEQYLKNVYYDRASRWLSSSSSPEIHPLIPFLKVYHQVSSDLSLRHSLVSQICSPLWQWVIKILKLLCHRVTFPPLNELLMFFIILQKQHSFWAQL